jgi:hypothetical protein
VHAVVVVPSHVRPQPAKPPVAQPARSPCGAPFTAWHVPGETSHASHSPAHALLQQTPSTQLPEAHCAADVHATPLLATHVPR